MRFIYLVPLLPALSGVAIGAAAYAAPFGNTGVDGTPGALLALIGAIASAAGLTLAMQFAINHLALKTLHVLIFLVAGLTSVAAYFLMQYAFVIAMVAVIVGLFTVTFFLSRRRAA